MVSVFTLAALAAQLSLPPGAQPGKWFNMPFPRKVTVGPQAMGQPPAKSGTCSIPLLNAMKSPARGTRWNMPALKPKVPGTMRAVDPPAPPCERWPPK
jgi:hypothetical protein